MRAGPIAAPSAISASTGRWTSNIVIRTASFRGGSCVVQAGGGIVTASDPASGYIETLDKARRIFEAFGAEDFANWEFAQ